MKNRLIFIIIILSFLFSTCKKDELEIYDVTINGYNVITGTTSVQITVRYTYPTALKSVVGYISPNIDMSDSKITNGEINDRRFIVQFENLVANTHYYYYYEYNNGVDVIKTSVKKVTTNDYNLPTVTTLNVSNITAIYATCGGNVTDDGGSAVTERGVCWSTIQNPTIADSHSTDGTGTGSFISNMTELAINTKYYVRAYAINIKGISYGEQKYFTTRDGLPIVTTSAVTDITETSAICGGFVSCDCGFEITHRGVCWSTSQNPTIADSHTTDGIGTGNFISNMTELDSYTFYYVRAYATNRTGTSYGAQKTFKVTDGTTGGKFSVSATKTVCFSQGNLQYIGSASPPYWRFAEHQWDYLGNNGQSSTSPDVDRDLFGWGTSGYSHGAVCYQPWSISQTNSDYYAYGNYSNNLNDQTGQADWGYNPISNGGNEPNRWRALTNGEWRYVFNTRSTSSGIRYAKARVCGVNGVMLLPDDWSSSYYSLSNTNTGNASYDSNTISASQWNKLEQHGAVFLPAAGVRSGTNVFNVGAYGFYWSATYNNNDYSYSVYFYDSYLNAANGRDRRYGQSVRLVCDVE